MAQIELIATATFGLEAVVAREVKNLGYQDVRVENARVTFSSDESGICRSNLWLRSADRVLIKMGRPGGIQNYRLQINKIKKAGGN